MRGNKCRLRSQYGLNKMYNGSGCVYTALSMATLSGYSPLPLKDVSTLHFQIPTGASALTETWTKNIKQSFYFYGWWFQITVLDGVLSYLLINSPLRQASFRRYRSRRHSNVENWPFCHENLAWLAIPPLCPSERLHFSLQIKNINILT